MDAPEAYQTAVFLLPRGCVQQPDSTAKAGGQPSHPQQSGSGYGAVVQPLGLFAPLPEVTGIMMGFTEDGQIHPQLLAERDEQVNVSTAEIKKKRADIPVPTVDPMASAWGRGELRQFVVSGNVDSALHMHQAPLQRHKQ